MSPTRPSGGERRAVFLDRDGVVIEEVNYLDHPDRLKLIPGSAEAIARLRGAGWKVIVVSNQSGVARGYFSLSVLRKITARLRGALALHGARLDAVYYCVHHPEAGRRIKCRCRKPGTLMLERAARRFKLKLSACAMVGDTTTDIQTAKNAGCMAVLVKTGKGGEDGAFPAKADVVCEDLSAFADRILKD